MPMPAQRLRLYLAFFLIYFIWGSTYLAIRYAIETIPPFLMAGGPRPAGKAVVGISLGILGALILVDPVHLAGSSIHLPGAGIVVLASVLWAIGSIYSKKFRQPASIFMSAACQMIGGGSSLLLTSLLLGETSSFDPGAVSAVSVAGFVYLMVFGSMIAISAYVWLLQNASASSVSTYAFVNPAVAILLGWFIAGEEINIHILAGAVVILVGVFLAIRAPRAAAA